MKFLQSLWLGLWGQAYLLLVLTTLMWAGNGIAGRLAIGEVSPMVLTCLRWVFVVAILLPFVGRQLVAERAQFKARWFFTLAMGIAGFTAFNALFYAAAHHTSAVNLTIFQGSIPVFVLIGMIAVFHARVIPLQIIGMAVTLIGVIAISVKADWEILKTLAINIGDLWMLIACVFYSVYTLGLRYRPQMPGLVFFTAMAIAAFVSSLPLVGVEMIQGTAQFPTPKGWLILLYVALMPSLLSQIFFIRGVELIGPARAGLFVNLVPVFGALLAVVLLGEPFALYHAVGLALVLGGIWLSERRR